MISMLTLWPLYLVGVQAMRGGWWYLLVPVALVALILDVVLNYTELALITWDFPRDMYELTFSNRLKRLVHYDNWQGSFARFIATKLLDPFDPSGKHI